MDLYLKDQKVKLHINGITYRVELATSITSIENQLLASDGFILTDSDGVYLTYIEE